jgi:hypothetical protein
MTSPALWCYCVLLGHLVAIAWHRTQRAKGYPMSTFLFDPRDRYNDLLNTWAEANRFPNPYWRDLPSATPYFPLVYWLLRHVRRDKAVLALRCAFAVFGAAFALLIGLPWWAAVALLVGYSTLFSDDRGNADYLLGAISACGVALLVRGYPIPGAICVGITVALKGYPAPLFLLWVLQRQWWSVGIGGATFVALFLLPAMTFEGGIRRTLVGLRNGMAGYANVAVMADRGPAYSVCHYCCDLFNAIRLLFWWRGDMNFNARRWAKPYLVFSTVWAAMLTYRAATTDTLWQAVMALCLFEVVWPSTANDYRLCALFPAIALWLMAGAPHPLIWSCSLLLWIPKNYWIPAPARSWASISCLVSPLFVIGLTIGVWL